MTNLAEARNVAVDFDVIGRIGKDRRRPLDPNQPGMRRLVARVATDGLVAPDEPKNADPGDGLPGDVGDRRLCGACLFRAEGLDPQIDLARVEADRLDVEVEFDTRQR